VTLVNRRVFQELSLLGIALFAILWAILRAIVQSVTTDEATTYMLFVDRQLHWVWFPSSNNHVLNTLLMWFAVHSFGPSSLTLRMPALLGALLYILICYFLCRSIAEQFSLRLPLFICLTFNPFIFDFMVAARGYSLADAFLLAAIAVPVWHHVKGLPSLGVSCGLASLALGLSFAANFSFAFVDLAAFLAILMWAIGRRGAGSVVRMIACCVLPGLLAALLICGYPLAHWSRAEMWWGAHSLNEMTASLVQSSLYQLGPRFARLAFLKPWLLPLLGILCFCQLLVTWLEGSWQVDARTRWLGRFATALAGIVALSVLLHWLAFRFENVPLPLGRTGIYLVPLCTLIAGVIGAQPDRSLASQWLRRGIKVMFVCLACYFLLCLRLNYFKEWRWDADEKDVYPVLARYNHVYGVTDVGAGWSCVAALNYYRAISQKETFQIFKLELPYPAVGRSVYVLNELFDVEFLIKEKLVVVYRGKSTGLVIAIKPGGSIPAAMIGS
jgi:hypothetical protein